MDNTDLVPDLKGNTCSFWLVSMMLAVGLSYMAFIMFCYVPSISTLPRVSIINKCWILSNVFSASIDMIIAWDMYLLIYLIRG